MPNAERHALWDTKEVPTLTTVYYWTSNRSFWWEYLWTELLLYVGTCASCSRRMDIFTSGWSAFSFCQKCYGLCEWRLLRKVDGKIFTSGMTSAVAQLRGLRFLPVGLHVVWVVPQQLVYCAVETAAVPWNKREHTMSDGWQHACSHKVLMLKVWLGCKHLNLLYWMLIENLVLYWLLQ